MRGLYALKYVLSVGVPPFLPFWGNFRPFNRRLTKDQPKIGMFYVSTYLFTTKVQLYIPTGHRESSQKHPFLPFLGHFRPFKRRLTEDQPKIGMLYVNTYLFALNYQVSALYTHWSSEK